MKFDRDFVMFLVGLFLVAVAVFMMVFSDLTLATIGVLGIIFIGVSRRKMRKRKN